MASVIDSLIVTLGLDASKFTKGQQEAINSLKKTSDQSAKTGKELELHAKKSAQAFSNLKNELLAVGALLVGGFGLKNFIADTIIQTAALGRMSANLDMSATSLSQWQHAAVIAGGTADGITGSLKSAQNALAELKTTGKMSDELLQTQIYGSGIGMDIGKITSANQLLMKQAEIIKSISDQHGISAARNIAGKMGISDEGVFNLLKDGSEALKKSLDAQKEVADAEARLSKSSEELRKEFIKMKNEFSALALSVMPPVLEGLKAFSGMLGSAQTKENIKYLIDGIGALANAFATFGKSMGWLMGRLNGSVEANGSGFKKGWPWERDTSLDSKSYKELKAIAEQRKKNAISVPVPNGSSNQNSIVNKLVGMGWTPEQAAGIVGSLQQESGLNHQATNPTSGAYGVAQWLGSRVKDFEAWSGKSLKNSSMDEQLAFMHYEMTQGKEQSAGRRLRATTNAADAAMVHRKYYERPGEHEANDARRIQNANNLLSQYNASNAASVSNLPLAYRPKGSNNISNSTASTDVNINAINIHTQATDANGISHGIGNAINNSIKFGVPNANQGLS